MKLFGKCVECKKKCYMPEECGCGMMFCTRHRLPEKHNCKDIEKKKEEYQESLRRKLVVVKAEKLVRI